MMRPQDNVDPVAMQHVVDALLTELEWLEAEEGEARARLEELTHRREKVETVAAFLRKELEELSPQMPEDAPLTSLAPNPQTDPSPPVELSIPTPTPQAAIARSAAPPAAALYPKNTLFSESGLTRYEYGKALLLSSDRGLTSTMLAQAFDGTDLPSRGRVEGARQALRKLVDDGVAERVSKNLYTAKRDQLTATAPDAKEDESR